MVTKPTSKSKASKKAAPIGLKNHAPANVSVPDEDRIRERAASEEDPPTRPNA